MSIPAGPQLTENEIRPARYREEQARLFAIDVARMMDRRSEFIEVACPACGESESTCAWSKYQLKYVDCNKCRTVYINPRPSPAVLEDYYKFSENYAFWNNFIFPASEDARRDKLFRPRAERLVEICRRQNVTGGVALEVGAGFGTFGQELTRLGFFSRFVAVEPTPDLAASCRRRGLDVIESPVEHISLPEGSVDVIASFEVIEHLFSPREFLTQCWRLLRPGGIMLVTCPNVGGFDLMTLREKSTTVDVEHLNYFLPTSLSFLFDRCGFDTLEVETPGRLDAELVRKAVLSGEQSLQDAFLQHVLIDNWEALGGPFQDFLVQHRLSSHLWLVGQKR